MIVIVEIKLEVPEDFKGGRFRGKDAALKNYVRHWLEEGFYTGDYYSVNLPAGIEYKGFKIRYGD